MSIRFDYIKYDAVSAAKQASIKTKCLELEALISAIEPGREQSLAMTQLEIVYARSGRAIRDEQIKLRSAVLGELRGNE